MILCQCGATAFVDLGQVAEVTGDGKDRKWIVHDHDYRCYKCAGYVTVEMKKPKSYHIKRDS